MSKLSFALFGVVFSIALIGLFVIYESSIYYAQFTIGDKYYFVKNQAMWFVLGTIACLVISRINYKLYYKIALPALVVSLILLVCVFLPGIGVSLKGAHRWINLGFTSFQPSEILKITLTIYLAAWLSVKEKGKFLAFLLLLGVCVFLVIIEPDMGTAMIIAGTSMIVYFLSGAPLRDMALIALFFVVGVTGLIIVEPYRLARLTAYQNVDSKDLSTTSYHVKQILVALGSGGVTGVGLGNSVQKYAYLPESTTDSIFAIYGEEAGFIGSVFLISLFLTAVFLGFAIAANSPDVFGKLLGAGIITFLAIQAFINIASQVVLIPLTGVPLPFISYGGTSLIINLTAIGILINIGNAKKKVQHIKPLRV